MCASARIKGHAKARGATMHEALCYQAADENQVRCNLCHHRCRIAEGKRGLCGVRQNQGGKLYSLVYGKIIAEQVDPIEKKPLYHFLPGSQAYSIGSVGCNFHCRHCQNFEISQAPRLGSGRIGGNDRTPAEIVAAAQAAGCSSIAYTYTEPTIFFEFAYDTAALAHQAGIKNVFVSNGYMSAEAAHRIAPLLDAVNIDLKAFTEKFYHEICGARLKPVLETIALMNSLGVWLEVTTLVIPGLNDSEQELAEIAAFVKGVGEEVPWHVSAFYPTYKLTDVPPTPVATLRRAREIGLQAGLRHVYEGNVPGEAGAHTTCPGCGAVVIARSGRGSVRNRLQQGRCPECGQRIEGVGL
jgi:pyruvate formate lyase activating enzyme